MTEQLPMGVPNAAQIIAKLTRETEQMREALALAENALAKHACICSGRWCCRTAFQNYPRTECDAYDAAKALAAIRKARNPT